MKKLSTIAFVLLLSSTAFADPTAEEVARARTFFDAGAQAYAAARYEDAARAFEQAYSLAPRAQLLFSLAQAERKSYYATSDVSYGRRALEHYKAYLDQVATGGRRSEATEGKADLEQRLRADPQAGAAPTTVEKRKPRVTVVSPTPGAKAQLDGAAAEELPFFADLGPGRHKVRVFAEGFFDEERDISGDKAGDVPVDAPLRERPASLTVPYGGSGELFVDGRLVATTPLSAPVDVPSGPHVLSLAVNGRRVATEETRLERGKSHVFSPRLETSGQRIAAWSLMGVGVAGIATGAVFGGLALGQESKVRSIESDAAAGTIAPDQVDVHNRAIDRRDAFRTVSVVALAGGAAIAAAGAVLFFFDRPRVDVVPPRSLEPTPTPQTKPLDVAAYPVLGPDTVGAGLVGRF